MRYELRTMGHATLCVLEDGVPLIATDPWLIGSVYWRSWWLEKYPTESDLATVRHAKHIYITHSHPDHFHLPTLRRIQPKSTLHPFFPGYSVPPYLRAHGFSARVLRPWQWYPLSATVRIMSVPAPIDDSLLIVETPTAIVANLNDANVPSLMIRRLRRTFTPGKPVIVLKSYSPASAGVATFRDGVRVPHRTSDDYAQVARRLAERLGATRFVPFASQAFFDRTDSRWANEYKVTYERLRENWRGSKVELVPPFVSMDLESLSFTSGYDLATRHLHAANLAKVEQREAEEAEFRPPEDFDLRLRDYFREIRLFRHLYPRGIGFRLSTTGGERFYNSKSGEVEDGIPSGNDFTITLPDKVLYESLCNGILTDLGITMLIRVDTNISTARTYAAFLLMGLRDTGYFKSPAAVGRLLKFYVPTMFGFRPGIRAAGAAASEEVRVDLGRSGLRVDAPAASLDARVD